VAESVSEDSASIMRIGLLPGGRRGGEFSRALPAVDLKLLKHTTLHLILEVEIRRIDLAISACMSGTPTLYAATN